MVKYLRIKSLMMGAGFGNLFTHLISGLAYCNKTGRKPVIDWAICLYGKNFFNKYFRCIGSEPIHKIKNKKSIVPAVWFRRKKIKVHLHLRDKLPKSRVYNSIDPLKNYSETVAYYTLNGWSHEMSIEESRKIYNQYIRPRQHIRKAADDFIKDNFIGKSIGVHIRYTDNKRRDYLIPDVEGIFRALDKEIAETVGPYTLFFATDNSDILQRAKLNYKKIVVVQKNLSVKAYHHNNTKECTKTTLLDFLILSSCDTFIFSSISTFALSIAIAANEKTKLIDVDTDRRHIRQTLYKGPING